MQAEIARLERQLLGPKTERVNVPPIDSELRNDGKMTDEQRSSARGDRAQAARARARQERRDGCRGGRVPRPRRDEAVRTVRWGACAPARARIELPPLCKNAVTSLSRSTKKAAMAAMRPSRLSPSSKSEHQ
jgi:hypothetical protein